MPAPVTSVFGRIGAVIAVLGDYAASLVNNDSTVTGDTVKDALDWLKGAIAAVAANLTALGVIVTSLERLHIVPVPTSKTAVATDNNGLQVCDSGSAIVITVNGGVMTAGDIIPIVHKGAGALSVLQGTSMTLVSRGNLLSSAGTGAYTALVFETTNRCYFVGDRA